MLPVRVDELVDGFNVIVGIVGYDPATTKNDWFHARLRLGLAMQTLFRVNRENNYASCSLSSPIESASARARAVVKSCVVVGEGEIPSPCLRAAMH